MTPEQQLRLAKLCGYALAFIEYGMVFTGEKDAEGYYYTFDPLSPDTMVKLMKKYGIGVNQHNNIENSENRWQATLYQRGMLVGINKNTYAFAPTPEEAVALCALEIE